MSSSSPQERTFLQRLTSRLVSIVVCVVVVLLMGNGFPPAVWSQIVSGQGTFSSWVLSLLLIAAWLFVVWLIISAIIGLFIKERK